MCIADERLREAVKSRLASTGSVHIDVMREVPAFALAAFGHQLSAAAEASDLFSLSELGDCDDASVPGAPERKLDYAGLPLGSAPLGRLRPRMGLLLFFAVPHRRRRSPV